MIRRLTCPICEKTLPPEIDGNSAVFPFCSSRCKQVDLHRWFSGSYSMVEQLTPEQLVEQFSDESCPPEEHI